MCEHVWVTIGKGLFDCCIYCGESRRTPKGIKMTLSNFFEQIITFLNNLVAILGSLIARL